MLEIDDATAGIISEIYIDLKKNIRQETVAFYDGDQTCYGDLDISNYEIYEIKNPYCLSDTYVFCKKHYNNVFLKGECDLIPYIKLNSAHQIEEAGSDFSKRFHFNDYDALLQRKDVKKADFLNKIIFSLFGDEYWLTTK